MEEFSHPKGLTWRVGALSRYESSWMACHRFTYLNAMNGQELYKLMTDHVGKQCSISGNNFEAYIWKSKNILGPFSDHMKERSISNLFGDAVDKLFSEVFIFRYCPECLKEIFHSPVFYFSCATHCPVHLVPLISGSQTGKNSIGSTRILPEIFKTPLKFVCNGIEFSQAPFSGRAAGEGQMASPVWEAIEQWLRRLQNWRFDGIHFRNGQYSNFKTIVYDAIFETMVLLCEPPSNNGWLKYQNSTIYVTKSQYMEASEEYWRGRECLSLNEDVDSACKIIKSIGRHLQKKVRAYCGHKGNGCLSWAVLGDHPSLLMDSNHCPYCSALIQWRAYAGKLLGLRAWVRERRRPLYDLSQFFRIDYSVDINICAEVALSSFTWFAVALARKLEAIQSSSGRMTFVNEELHIQQCKKWDAYDLPVQKHEFQFKGVRFKNICGESSYFRFSLRFAFNELGKCKNGVKPFGWGSRRNHDMWYIESSLEDVRRFGIRYGHYFSDAFNVLG